ncbi:hypothetical protein ARC63_02420 [Stenotrophomonas geniculata ATCC 19374 = JCM 13324]|nr:hypothetical protein ARC63_02420 [Stenotrophomonas geniculata ATCC 19374 = JCM 13324]
MGIAAETALLFIRWLRALAILVVLLLLLSLLAGLLPAGFAPLALPLLYRLFCFSGRVGAVIPVLFGDAVHFDSPPQQVCCRLTVGVSPLRERTGTRPI